MSLVINNPTSVFSYITDNKTDKIIDTLSYEADNKNGFIDLELKSDLRFELAPIPKKELERICLYVAGESGSGKSYFIREYVKRYNKLFPKNPIYLISYLKQDKTIDEFKRIIRIEWENIDFLTECTKDDFFCSLSNSFIIFDDVDSIPNKNKKDVIYKLIHKILRIGRHHNISTAIVSHELYANHELKLILNECHCITYFPQRLNHRKQKYLLENYFGLSKEQIQKIKSIEDRSITYIKLFDDKIILSSHHCFLL
jgi:Cdc6-like AAA superfamily ATPase